MWYTKAALMLANDHLPADEQLDWNRSEYTLSLYLYLKKEQGVCVRPDDVPFFDGLQSDNPSALRPSRGPEPCVLLRNSIQALLSADRSLARRKRGSF